MDEWISGYPKAAGNYLCLVDGQEIVLRHFICQISNRHEWADKKGNYIYDSVKWRKIPE